MTRSLLTMIFVLTWMALTSPAAATVVLDGVSDRQALNIRAFLGLSELDCDAPPWLVRWQFRRASNEIRTSLEALGYYSTQVEQELTFPTGECWRARFQILPGDPVYVREVNLTIDSPLANETAIAARVAQARDLKNQQLNHGTYEDLRRGLLETAQSLGYFDAEFKVNEVRVDPDAYRATVNLELVGGARYTFGDIEVIGDFLNRRLVDAYIPFHTGEPFDASLVARLRRNLADSGYFGRSTVLADNEAAVDRAVPIRIALYPRARNWTYSAGVGYATDTGPRVRFDADNYLVNESGHRISVRSVFSSNRSSLDLQDRIPHLDPVDNWFILDAGLAHIETDTSESDIQRVGARHTYRRGEWIQTDFVDLTYEDFKIGDEFGDSRLVLFGSTLSRMWRDQPNRPTEGFRLDATLRGATQQLGSDTDFVQFLVNGRMIQGLSENWRALVRTTAGWTWKDDFGDLPPSIRFFAGGDTSIRGYAFQSVGPERDGNVVGGSRLLTGSVELDYRFRPNWSVAAFVDSGSAFDSSPQFFTGVGVGIRWFSAVGPIRIDVAHPLDDPSTQWRLNVTVGPDL